MKTRVLAATCLALVALAGCSSTDEYVDTVNEIQKETIEASNAIGSDVTASKNEVVAAIENAEAQADNAVEELSEVDVPDDAQEGHEKLVDGFEDLKKLFGDVREQVESNSGASPFSVLQTEAAKIDKEIDAALDQINSDLGLE